VPLLICELFVCTTPNNKYYKYIEGKDGNGLIFLQPKKWSFFFYNIIKKMLLLYTIYTNGSNNIETTTISTLH
jgi:hypothetical protein